MNMQRSSLLVILGATWWLMTSCVSIRLDSGDVKRSSDVEFKAPPAPFVGASVKNVDEAWKNPRNGNSISFLTDCSEGVDPTLEALQEGILRSVGKSQIVESKEFTYNQRKALLTRAKGEVDGITSEFELLVFKKNGCVYTLTYVALEKSFSENQKAFETFWQEFKAP